MAVVGPDNGIRRERMRQQESTHRELIRMFWTRDDHERAVTRLGVCKLTKQNAD